MQWHCSKSAAVNFLDGNSAVEQLFAFSRCHYVCAYVRVCVGWEGVFVSSLGKFIWDNISCYRF